jgi:TatD DNase family protein
MIDIGANLAHDSFDEDRPEVVQRALDAGVTQLVITGSSNDSNKQALALAREYPGVMYSTAGVHPHHASEYNDISHAIIRECIEAPECVAVGECGLDYFRNFSPRDAQLSAFKRQLDIAAESGLPVFLHQRDAHEDFVDVLQARRADISRAVAHCFTGEEDALRTYIDMDLYVGITGWICDERRGGHLQDIVGLIPNERLLIETDAPYLLPRSLRPKPKSRRNEPAYLPEVLRVIAAARGQSETDIAEQTTANAQRFFAIPGNAR